MQRPILLVIGTRAEAIKLIPLYLSLKKENIPVLLCATFQHSELLQQVCNIFNVIPDFNLDVMIENQDLFHLQNTIMNRIKNVYLNINPLLVLVHGDTTTTMAAALSAFYLHISVGHVEAGLRTGNINSPFPEEMNRKVVGQIAKYHFTPTAFSTANLLSEGVPRKNVFCTGNTIVDALIWMKDKIERNHIKINEKIKFLVAACKNKKQKMVLLTAHRRESFNGGLLKIFNSMKKFSQDFSDIFIFYPMHPNPNVLSAVKESGIKTVHNIYTSNPLLYKDLIYLLMNVDWVATDSGGIQEEAVSLGKPVLVLRDLTERWEGIWDGSEELVGTDEKLILQAMKKCYHSCYLKRSKSSVYGDGNACNRIVSIIKNKIDFDDILNLYKSNSINNNQTKI